MTAGERVSAGERAPVVATLDAAPPVAPPDVTVALATAARLPAGMADTPGLVRALAGRGARALLQAWDDPDTDWSGFGLVLPHCTWDYLERQREFFGWLGACGRSGLLPNSVRLLEWSRDKAYLLQLADRGIAVPPTLRLERGGDAAAVALRAGLGRGSLVVKPAVGGGGHRIWRCTGPDEAAQVARAELAGEAVLVQAFEPAVTREGEYSAVFIAGRASHAVRKRPREGDFRVHRRYGATREAVSLAPWMVAYGRRVLGLLGEEPGELPLYARVDFVLPAEGEPVLMEVELLEPDLYLREFPGAGERFAAALAARARTGRPRQ